MLSGFIMETSLLHKRLSFKGEIMFVKENYMLSRECVTTFMEAISEELYILPPAEFVFKGKGKWPSSMCTFPLG